MTGMAKLTMTYDVQQQLRIIEMKANYIYEKSTNKIGNFKAIEKLDVLHFIGWMDRWIQLYLIFSSQLCVL